MDAKSFEIARFLLYLSNMLILLISKKTSRDMGLAYPFIGQVYNVFAFIREFSLISDQANIKNGYRFIYATI